jgi:hypothetical protein
VDGESLPPGWLSPKHSNQNLGMLVDELRLLSEQPRLAGHPIWGSPLQSTEWDERWLYWSVWRKLDSCSVYIPVYLLFTALACLSPAVIYGRWRLIRSIDLQASTGSSSDWEQLPVAYNSLGAIVAYMHMVGTAFFWVAFIFLFHNLRIVVRERVAFVRQVAREMGVKERAIQRCINRDDVIDLIMHQFEHEWPQTLATLQTKAKQAEKLQAVIFIQTRYRSIMKSRKQVPIKLKSFSQQSQAISHASKQFQALQHEVRLRRQMTMSAEMLHSMDTKNSALDSSTELDGEEQLTHAAKKKLIQNCTLFQQALGEHHAEYADVHEQLARLCVSRRYEKGQMIAVQGSQEKDMFILASGEVSAYLIHGGHNNRFLCNYKP